ncbi:MAG: NTP/NDP exchange transporter [Oscillospiraceae bacterium]|jgi:AAA family ATP:ADP antiporter|nr:NTP/NDP exchange transporter [Oscillospiraceae bacterium]
MIEDGEEAKFKKFGKLRSYIWPIHYCEIKRFLPTSFMMFCALFIFALTRDLKDAVLINAPGAEPACISSLKIYGVLPMAVLSVVLFGKILRKFGDKNAFYIVISTFLVFYTFFGLVLYPMSDSIHLGKPWIENMQSNFPPITRDLWPLFANWSFSLFYILSEVWGSLVLSFLFWQFANKVTKQNEVGRFYALFAFIGNIALILSGFFAKITISFSDNVRVATQMMAILVIGLIFMALHYYVDKKVLRGMSFYNKIQTKSTKLGFFQSFKCVVKSRYLFFIAILVISYGVAVNISEVIWKEQGKLLHGSEGKFNGMMSDLSITTGVVTIFVTMICGSILRKCKWKTAALITPISVLLLGGAFLVLIFYENIVGTEAKFFTLGIVEIAVWVGLVQDAVSKGIKYSLFDCTKQMAYRPLSEEAKANGQAAVEVIGSRFGKSLGSISIIGIRALCGGKVPLYSIVSFLSLILLIVIGTWIWSVLGLSKQYEILQSEKDHDYDKKKTA